MPRNSWWREMYKLLIITRFAALTVRHGQSGAQEKIGVQLRPIDPTGVAAPQSNPIATDGESRFWIRTQP